jgi:thiosulfate/3-mercaptopyruvate sulfurtransferase
VIDARSPDRYRGENETLDSAAGHIPGAYNRFFRDNLDTEGRFKPKEQLASEFNALLAAPEISTLVSQCGSGVTACHNLLALEIAGIENAVLYPGSWSEWSATPGMPIATGNESGR